MILLLFKHWPANFIGTQLFIQYIHFNKEFFEPKNTQMI